MSQYQALITKSNLEISQLVHDMLMDSELIAVKAEISRIDILASPRMINGVLQYHLPPILQAARDEMANMLVTLQTRKYPDLFDVDKK